MTRFIYQDEAGTSLKEPVRVVAGIIIHADRQLREMTKHIDVLVKRRVPNQYQENFWFHALAVFSGGRDIDRKVWSFEDRLAFYKEFVSVPFLFGAPVALGAAYNDATLAAHGPIKHKIEHAEAFLLCVERVEYFLRDVLHETETGTIISEDHPEMKKYLSRLFVALRGEGLKVNQHDKRQSRTQRELGIKAEPVEYNVRCIADVPHFVEKGKAPMLQLADACAFAFRRCLAKQSEGNELVLALLGPVNGREFIENDAMFEHASGALLNVAN
jgi:hypothetical protein